jgi:hypothetical protein
LYLEPGASNLDSARREDGLMMLLSETPAIPDGLVKHSGEFMGDEHSEPKKNPIWTGLGVLSGVFIAQCIHQHILHWHAFRDQGLMAGFKTVRWDDFLVRALTAGGGLIVALLLAQPQEITTLGVGEVTAKKLR